MLVADAVFFVNQAGQLFVGASGIFLQDTTVLAVGAAAGTGAGAAASPTGGLQRASGRATGLGVTSAFSTIPGGKDKRVHGNSDATGAARATGIRGSAGFAHTTGLGGAEGAAQAIVQSLRHWRQLRCWTGFSAIRRGRGGLRRWPWQCGGGVPDRYCGLCRGLWRGRRRVFVRRCRQCPGLRRRRWRRCYRRCGLCPGVRRCGIRLGVGCRGRSQRVRLCGGAVCLRGGFQRPCGRRWRRRCCLPRNRCWSGFRCRSRGG